MITKNIKYREILERNNELSKLLPDEKYEIKILSNIITSQLNEILEYTLRMDGIPAIVKSGNYDNIVQDSQKYEESKTIIIFWELSNIIDGLHYKIELLNNDQIDEIYEKTKSEIDLVLKFLEKTSLVLINKFSSIHFCCLNVKETSLETLEDRLNQYLKNKLTSNVRLIDLGKIFTTLGISNSLDLRYYYSKKALYSVDFFRIYADYVSHFIMSANGKSKKALIFDCDNTLWKCIVGEDGFENIEMSTKTKDGAIFAEIQAMAVALNKQGILIGLCSKNNSVDVDEVIKFHPDMQLRDEHITIKKCNWSDKVNNLKEISQELNIGLDSLVFIDDSSFEVNLIREHLPAVTVLQVPDRLFEYPKLIRENLGLFYNLSFTNEDKNKIKMYYQDSKRVEVEKEFTNLENYITSLELKITFFENDESIIPRMAQMSQKTNQFNLTTKRYTEGDIKNFIDDSNSDVYAFSLADKFGDSGVTGMSIITSNGKSKIAEIDTFLMSCRVIGRNIEYSFVDYVIEKRKEKKNEKIKAKYIKTPKNEQVEKFFDKCSFKLNESNDSIRYYTLNISKYVPKKLKYIEVINEK